MRIEQRRVVLNVPENTGPGVSVPQNAAEAQDSISAKTAQIAELEAGLAECIAHGFCTSAKRNNEQSRMNPIRLQQRKRIERCTTTAQHVQCIASSAQPQFDVARKLRCQVFVFKSSSRTREMLSVAR